MSFHDPHVVYVKTNPNSYITEVDSSAFLMNTTGWEEVDRGYGDRFKYAQSSYFPEFIFTDGGAYRYKLVDGKPVECTVKEITAQEEALKPKPIVQRNIVAGEYVTVNGILYKAMVNIPNGGVIITGQNAVATTIEEQLAELAKGE